MSNFFTEKSEEMVGDNFADTVEWELVKTDERLREVAVELAAESTLAIDTENAGLDPHLKWALLLQIGTSDKCYIFEHYAGLDFSPIKEVLEDESILKVFFNAKYDWKWIFVHYGIRINNVFCCQIAERVLTVGLPGSKIHPSLRDVVEKYLSIQLKKEARSGFINRDYEFEPITDAEFAYSAADVVLLPEICALQIGRLNKLEVQLAAQLEFDVLPPTAESEVLGVLIDQEQWRKLLVRAKEKFDSLSKDLYACFDSVVAQKTLFGFPTFKLTSNKQLLKNLNKLLRINNLKFELEATDGDTLKKYKGQHEVFDLLLPWRGYQKVLSTYGEKLLARINPTTGRLHCQFNQVRAGTGRMSSEKPNLQNIPGYDPEDPTSLDFRSCFLAKPKYRLITADYSQQELRILADMSGDPTFYKAYTELDENGKALDVHKYTASAIFEVPYEDVTDEQRKKAKTLNFFLVYGGGPYSLALTLKISKEEAEQIIYDYFQRYDKIKYLLDSFGASALNKGWVQTISGRKRFLLMPTDLQPGTDEFKKARASIKRQAGNTPVQGCLVGSTRVLTQLGYQPISTLEGSGADVGVWTGTHYAAAHAVYKGNWESAKVVLQDGSTIRCDTRHKFLVPGDTDYVWKDYDELQEGDFVCRSLARTKEFFPQDRTSLPKEHRSGWWYWLGRYIGDGNIFYKKRERGHRATLCYAFGSHEAKAIDACVTFWKDLGYNPRVDASTHTPCKKESTRYRVSINNKKLVEKLMSMGFTQTTAHTKRLPQVVFELPVSLRTEFIRGLFEAGGWLPSGGTGSMPSLHLCQRSLLEDTKVILHSLGAESSINGPYSYSEFTSYRLDVCGTMLTELLGTKYNNDRPRLKCAPPEFVLNNFRSKYSGQVPDSATRSDKALLRRVYSGGSTSVYTLKDLLNKFGWSVDYPLYVTKECMSKESTGQTVKTYTMLMSDPAHRFDAEGVITHNSGADVTKLGIVFVHRRLLKEGFDARILMVVHDELVVEAKEHESEVVAKIVEEEMVRAFTYYFKNIPMVVDAHIGPTWEK